MSTGLVDCLGSLVNRCTRWDIADAASTTLNLSTPCTLAWLLAGSSHRMDWGSVAGLGPEHSKLESFIVSAGLPFLKDMLPQQFKLGWMGAIACLSTSLRGILSSASLCPEINTTPVPVLLSARISFTSHFKAMRLPGGCGTPPLALLLLPSALIPKWDIGSTDISVASQQVLLDALKSLNSLSKSDEAIVSYAYNVYYIAAPMNS